MLSPYCLMLMVDVTIRKNIHCHAGCKVATRWTAHGLWFMYTQDISELEMQSFALARAGPLATSCERRLTPSVRGPASSGWCTAGSNPPPGSGSTHRRCAAGARGSSLAFPCHPVLWLPSARAERPSERRLGFGQGRSGVIAAARDVSRR